MKQAGLLLVLILIALICALAAAPAASPASAAVIHPAVLAALRAAPDGQATFFVLFADQADLSAAEGMHGWEARGRWVFERLQATATASQAQMQKLLEDRKTLDGHVSHWRSFWIVNALLVRGDAEAVQVLARQPGVAQILPQVKLDPPELIPATAAASQVPATVEWNVQQINADDVWALGYTGQGLVVANVDTGVDYTHPALVQQYRGNRGSDGSGPFDHDYNWYDPFWGTTEPQALPSTATSTSPHSHGTHVMGTEAGSDGGVNQIGVAPGARWIAAYGCCPDNESLLAALQWHLAPTRINGSDPNPDLRPHALQNSWGGPGGSLIFQQAMAALKAAGIFVSASAGNNGVYGCGSMGSPGDNPAVFSVGASTSSDMLASISARGPNPFSRSIGPDLVAPGQSVRSSVPGGGYSRSTGTSMAGPHVAGAVALLWQANPALIGRVDYTAELLRKTAEPLYVPGEVCGQVDSGSAHPNNSTGWGRLDILRAVQVAGTKHARSRLWVEVADEAGAPLPGAVVTLHKPEPGLGQVALQGETDEAGRFEFLVAAGPVTVTAELFGYKPLQVTTTVPYQLLFPKVAKNGSKAGQVRSANGPNALPTSVAAFPPQLDLSLSPLPQVAIHGLVHEVNDTGKPLAARVSLPGSPLLPVTTDSTGTFTLTLPVGNHQLLVEALGYLPQQVPISLTTAITPTIALTPTWDYTVEDSRDGSVAYEWIDATAGTRYTLSDDDWEQIDLPAGRTFSYYGQPYTRLTISSNGFVGFGTPFARFHGVIPFEGLPNNAIYAYAEDLNPAARTQYGTPYDNGIYALLDGDRFVLQYNEVEHWSQGNPETFELILDLATGEIVTQYRQVSWPDFTTVGVEDPAGQRGFAYSYANSADLAPGLAVRYTPVYGQPAGR